MQRSRIVAWILAVACLLAGAAHAKERITANAVKVGPGTKSGYFSVELDRYSTDEERARWRETFIKGGQDALVEAWQDSDVTLGNCRFSQTLGYRIRAAISSVDGIAQAALAPDSTSCAAKAKRSAIAIRGRRTGETGFE